MAEVSSYPVAIPTRIENTISVATLRGEQTNDATYSHALIHQQVGADVVAIATYIGTNASQTAPVANTVLYSGSNGVSAWSASPTLTTLTLSTDLIVDTNTFVVDGSDSRVYVGATSSSATEILQVFGSARVQSGTPELRINETDAAADNKEWKFGVASEQLYGSIVNDAGNTTTNWLQVNRTGTTVDTIWHPHIVLGTETTMPNVITKLFINDATAGQIRVTGGGTSLYMGADVNEPFIGSLSNNALRFTTNATSKWAILADGTFRAINDNTYSFGNGSFRATAIYAVNGTIQTSDIRQKTVVENYEMPGLNFVNGLNPIAFKWKDAKKKVVDEDGNETWEQKEENEKRTHLGFSAQAVEQLVFDAGLTTQDFAGVVIDEDENGNKTYGLRSDQFIPILVKAVQELEARVKELES